MKLTKILSASVIAAAALGFAACADTDAQYTIKAVDAPVLVSSTPAEGEVISQAGDMTIVLTYDKNIFFAPSKFAELQMVGGTVKSAYGDGETLNVEVNIPELGTVCSLTVPYGIVKGPNQMEAQEVTLNFSTKALPAIATSPVAGASTEAVKLYSFLLSNYKTNIISGMMANVAWNNECSEQVYQWTGKYPAINGYDYIHVPASAQGANWIDYSDITPVKEWSDAGGIVVIGWHWLAPVKEITEEGPAPAPTTDGILWEGTSDMGASWGANVSIAADKLSDAAEGKVLTVYFTQNSDVTYWQVKAMDSNWNALASYKDIDNGWGCIDTKSGDTSVSITLNSDDAAAIKANGLILSGYGLTYTKVTLSDGSRAASRAMMRTSYSELDPNTDFSYEKDVFDLDNAVTDGTWENTFVKADLERVATYLKLLKEAGIPVLWRPLHEASGGWFWWGKNAESFKKLWQMMFDYFKAQGLDNLIWVWTSQGDDDSWYPGDNYVDVIGRDLYGSTAAACAEEYQSLIQKYGKIVTLSECGYSSYTSSRVGAIADQWAAGAKWSWFMPWYDGSDTADDAKHADKAWWEAAMQMENVITRDKVNLK